MSESSLSDVIPSDGVLEQALRRAVQLAHKKGDLEAITVKRMRKAAEEDLDLQEGFFKQDQTWESKSKRIIVAEAEAQDNAPPTEHNVPSRQSELANPRDRPPKRVKSSAPKPRSKRSSKGDSSTRKRQKLSDVSEPEDPNNEDSSALSDASMEKEPQKKARNKAHKIDSAERSTPETIETEKHEGNAAPDHAKSESEMSEVMDEDPKPKPRKRRSAPGEGKTKTVAKPKEKKSKPQDTNPDGEEIKRLQGWLVKCGIRKMWYRELAPYDNPKAKIRHLKEMLADAGMIGRYSAEKATQIREARELKSELEAVQAGAKQWGTGGSDGEDDAKPKRRLARGLQNLDFLNDDDGAESD